MLGHRHDAVGVSTARTSVLERSNDGRVRSKVENIFLQLPAGAIGMTSPSKCIDVLCKPDDGLREWTYENNCTCFSG